MIQDGIRGVGIVIEQIVGKSAPKRGIIVDKRKLNIQIARLLNESNEYRCGFMVIGEDLYSITTGENKCDYDIIDPEMYLKSVKAVRYEDSQTD